MSKILKMKELLAKSRLQKAVNPQAMAHDMKQKQAEAILGMKKPKEIKSKMPKPKSPFPKLSG